MKRLVLGAMATTFTFLLLLTAPPAQAVTIEPNLCLGSTNSCPGPNPTLGPAPDPGTGIYDFPWITAVFDGAGSVTLTMTASLVENEKLHFWYFNLDPALNPDSLVFTPVSGAEVVSGIDTGADAFTRAGAGSFDIEFTFNQGNTDNFDNNDVVVYTITCPTCVGVFNASSFDVVNPPDPGNSPYFNHENGAVSHGPFRTLAQLTATGDWIAGVGGGVSVPEPATVLLLGAGLTGLGLVARKRSRKD